MLDDVIGMRFAVVTTGTPDGVFVRRFGDDLGGVILTLGKDIYDYQGELTPWLEENKVSSVLIRPLHLRCRTTSE